MSIRKHEQVNPSIQEILDDLQAQEKFLVLYNDDVHTFDFVINTLIEVCKHDTEQAEQCTYIVHYKGKCDVKKGPKGYLSPMKEELNKRGLTATID